MEPSTGERARVRELRLRGRGPARHDEVEDRLTALGLVTRADGRVVLSDAGLEAHAAWALLPAGSPSGAAARGCYQRFVEINGRLLDCLTRWQVLSTGVPNDHSDAAYDFGVLDRVDAAVEDAAHALERLGSLEPDFSGYAGRLRSALRRAERGEREWLASPRVESVHAVWMELHASLLDAVGAARADEEPVP